MTRKHDQLNLVVSMISGIGGLLATIAIAFFGYRIDAANRARDETEQHAAFIAQITPIVVGNDLKQQNFALQALLAEGIPDRMCPAVLQLVARPTLDPWVAREVRRACAKQVVAELQKDPDDLHDGALLNYLVDYVDEEDVRRLTELPGNEKLNARIDAAFSEIYDVNLIATHTQQAANVFKESHQDIFAKAGLKPVCIHAGKLFMIAISDHMTLSLAKATLTNLREFNVDGYLQKVTAGAAAEKRTECF